MAFVKFYRGKKEKYNATTHKDGVFFAKDTQEILLDGVSYGYRASTHKEIQRVEYIVPNIIRIYYTNDTVDVVKLQTAEAGNTIENSKAGLMTAAMAHKLSKINENAESNVIDTIAVDGVTILPNNKKVNIDTTPLKKSIEENRVSPINESISVVAGGTSGGGTRPTQIGVNLVPNGGIELTSNGLKVSSKALEEYKGDGGAINVDTTVNDSNQKVVRLKLDPKGANLLNVSDKGLYASVKLKKLNTTTNDQIATSYGLFGVLANGTEFNLGDTTIDILKDKFLKNVELGKIPQGQTGAGNDALIFTFTIANGTDVVRYVDVSTFLREAETGNGISLDDTKKLTIKVNPNGEKNSDNQNYLKLTSDGLEITGLNKALNSAKTVVKHNTNNKFVSTVTTQGSNGESIVTINEHDIASANQLTRVSAKVDTLLMSVNSTLNEVLSWHEAE